MTRLWPEGEPIQVRSEEEPPTCFLWHAETHHMLDTCNCWRIHTCWWEPEHAVWREYLKVITDTGLLCLIYQDLLSGAWFLCRVYD